MTSQAAEEYSDKIQTKVNEKDITTSLVTEAALHRISQILLYLVILDVEKL